MRTIHIFDPQLHSNGGHYLNHDSQLAREAILRGYEVKIYGKKTASIKCEGINVDPLFSADIFAEHSSDEFLWALENFTYLNKSFENDLASLNPNNFSSNDLAYFPNILQNQLLGVASWLRRLPADARPACAFMLRYLNHKMAYLQSRKAVSTIPSLYKTAGEILYSLQPRSRICSDTKELADAYSAIFGREVLELPNPMDANKFQIKSKEKTKKNELTVLFQGHTSPLKGFHFLPEIIFRVSRIQPNTKFLVQIQNPDTARNMGLEKTVADLRKLAAPSRLELIEGELEAGEYYKILDDADIILLPYNPDFYGFGSSGVFTEAASLGKVIVVPARTVPARQGKEFGLGVVIAEEWTPASISEATIKAVKNYHALEKMSRGASEAFRDNQSASNLWSILLGKMGFPQNLASGPVLPPASEGHPQQNSPDSTAQSIPAKEKDETNIVISNIKSDSYDEKNAEELVKFRQQLVRELIGFPLNELKTAFENDFGRKFRMLLGSGIQDECSATETEKELLDGDTSNDKRFNLKRSIATLLFSRAHISELPLSFESIPSWFFEDYVLYQIFAPEYFKKIGEADQYKRHIRAVLEEILRIICKEPRSPQSLKLSQIVAAKLNVIPLLFNRDGNREIYALRARIIAHYLESRGFKLNEAAVKAPANRQRIKVGFLNAHFSSQTETYTSIPAFSHLDRRRFEVVVYSLNSGGGILENYCRSRSEEFVVLPKELDGQVNKIRGDALDAIVLGTNVTAVTNQVALLASFRLAPVQLVNNSSPVTSGMANVDGYLSGSFLVDPDTADQYSEKVLEFDGAAHCFNYEVDRRPPVVKISRGDLGIPQDAVVYFSGANCFKIIPEMQEAWARILAKVPGSVLLLHPFNPNWASQYPVRRFERNMLAALARHGVEANRLVLSRERLPSRSDVLELIKLSDIYLDSFPFAGVNSAVDPLEVGIPLVACEMQTFRSRMAGSLLRELKIEELIASGEDEYIDLATKLGLDSAYRAEVSQKIVFAMGQNPRFLDSAAYSANMGRIIESLVGRSLPEAMPKVGDFTMQDAQTAFAEGRLSDAEDICREILGKDERCAGAWYLMGKMAVLQGDLETAGDFASVACDLEPENAEFVRGLAEVFFFKKELVSAEEQARRALELAPDSSEGLVLQGRILADKGEKSAALEAFQEAVRLRKDFADGFSNYALALQKFGRGKDAISQIRKACALEPDSVEFQTNLAMLLEQNARYVDALAAYGKAARMNPNVGFVWFRQGRLLNGLKRYAEAIPLFEKAVALPGQMGEYHYEYGLALHMCKRFQEALAQYQKALSMGYNTAALQCNCGVIYKDLRKGGDAIMAFHSAVTMEPTNVSYLNNLGAAALELGLNSEALECFEQAVEKNPKLPTARNNIGNLLKDRGRGMDALPQYRKSIELNPDDRDVQSNYLLCHMYIPDMDPKVVFEEHKKWGVAASKKIPPAFKFKPRQSGAKLRVGFLSADLCHHPVAYFIESLFREYDRGHFEFVAYGDQRNSDDFSARFAKQVDLWRETSSYDDSKLAKLIHEDQLDILFELSGHTAYNRLGVFALKPAPLQVSYLGYPGTTGLPTIGYRITDAFADPPGTTEHLHTEKLIRLKGCAWCFQPDAAAPEVQPLPALKNGYVTFGCFNNMAKLNPPLFETWAEILLRVPGSHLRLKARTLTDDGVRKELKAYFTDRGIEEERLDFFGHTKKIVEHLSHYHSVDIALDSFPYHGTTTTCEAMWMGCPVITRAGKTHVSRVGVSLLNNVGLTEFITDTRETYIAKAAELASDTERLIELRAGMRARLQSSPIMDASAFAGNFAQALNEIAVDR
jgi:predicted O-linked N-acetylglucosamine transferase (SPINDLY family)/glycosyltransferase involved in cell wall biosynthesis